MTRVGIVGAGFMGTTHAQGWAATDATITAFVAGPDSPPRALADQYGAKACTDFDELLQAVDVVDVCAPTHLHADFVLAAAAAGRHVICEKPLARTVAQGERMVAACRAAGVHLLVGHVVRFFPEYAAAKAQADQGVIGTPAVIRLQRATFQPKKPSANWFVDPRKSGGLVFDLMIHDLDYARWVGGDVGTVYARSVRGARPDAPADHAVAILTHRGGALSHIEASWAYPAPTFRTGGEIAGDGGLVAWDGEDMNPVRAWLRGDGEDRDIPALASIMGESPYTSQIRHFLAVLRGETPPIVSAEDGLEALRLAAAADASIARGRPVRVKEMT